MAKRTSSTTKTRRPAAIVIAAFSVLAATVGLFSATAAPVAIGADGGLVSCGFSDSTDGVVVAWASVDSTADRVVVERSIVGTDQFEVRGEATASDGTWTDIDLAGLVPDAEVENPLDRAASTLDYRVVMVDDDSAGGEILATVPCAWSRGNSGRFECTVELSEGGYLVQWTGGPTGAGLDYIVERDVNDEDVFHWRARRFDRQFADEGSRQLPVYRVTARFDRDVAVSTQCALDGIVAMLAPDATFVCPAPGASFIDTFGADRDGGARQHKGVDMFAPVGSPVVAPESGELVLFWNELGGRSFGLYADSGTFYYGAHLDSFVGEDRRVVAGELVGTVGNTGNARTTPPHLHFQVHPEGRRTAAANPTSATAEACRPT